MSNFVIDTNIFFNMEAKLGVGNTTKEIVEKMETVLKKSNIKLYTSPLILNEIRTFFKDENDPIFFKIAKFLNIKSPNVNKINISAKIFETLIDNYRDRTYKGMKVAEEEIAETAKLFMGKEVLAHKEFQITVGKRISNLRDRFRNATRTGVLDSQADLEIVLLSLELNFPLVSTDEGVIKWSRIFGVFETTPYVFGKMLQEYL